MHYWFLSLRSTGNKASGTSHFVLNSVYPTRLLSIFQEVCGTLRTDMGVAVSRTMGRRVGAGEERRSCESRAEGLIPSYPPKHLLFLFVFYESIKILLKTHTQTTLTTQSHWRWREEKGSWLLFSHSHSALKAHAFSPQICIFYLSKTKWPPSKKYSLSITIQSENKTSFIYCVLLISGLP